MIKPAKKLSQNAIVIMLIATKENHFDAPVAEKALKENSMSVQNLLNKLPKFGHII